MLGGIALQYNVKVHGIHDPEAIEYMNQVLQLTLDTLANRFNLIIDSELMSFSGVERDGVDKR
jgi:hypothetical protein